MRPAAMKYDDVAAVNKVAAVQAQVDDVKMTMEDNVQQMLRQHEKLEDLEDKADTMRSEASKFKRGAGNLASKMWWQNVRLWCIVGLIAIIVIVIIVFSVCGSTCTGGGGSRRALLASLEGDTKHVGALPDKPLQRFVQTSTLAVPVLMP